MIRIGWCIFLVGFIISTMASIPKPGQHFKLRGKVEFSKTDIVHPQNIAKKLTGNYDKKTSQEIKELYKYTLEKFDKKNIEVLKNEKDEAKLKKVVIDEFHQILKDKNFYEGAKFKNFICNLSIKHEAELNQNIIPEDVENKLKEKKIDLDESSTVKKLGNKWLLEDPRNKKKYIIIEFGKLLKIYSETKINSDVQRFAERYYKLNSYPEISFKKNKVEFSFDIKNQKDFDSNVIPENLVKKFNINVTKSGLKNIAKDSIWLIEDKENKKQYFILKEKDKDKIKKDPKAKILNVYFGEKFELEEKVTGYLNRLFLEQILEDDIASIASIPSIPIIVLGMFIGIAGLIFMYLGRNLKIKKLQEKSQGEQKETSDKFSFDESIKNLVNALKNIEIPQNDFTPEQKISIRKAIEEAQTNFILPIVNKRAYLSQTMGLEAFSKMFGDFSTGERYVNRAWSSIVDDHLDETRNSINIAIESFENSINSL